LLASSGWDWLGDVVQVPQIFRDATAANQVLLHLIS
jgi:hypothetical protein